MFHRTNALGIRTDLGVSVKELGLALFLFIDLYYRTEWLYLHTSWGHILLAGIFGGEH